MLNDRVVLLFRQGITGVIVHTIVTGVLVYLFWDEVPQTHLAAWAAVMLVLGWTRGVVIYLFQHTDRQEGDAALWATIFVVLISLVGVTWGYAGVWLVPDSTFEQVMYILLLGGTAAGTATTLAPLYFAIVIALTTSLIPLILRFATEGQFEQQLMAAALVMFFMTMMATARNASNTITLTLSLRQENAALVSSLEHERHALEISNRAKTRFLAAASHDLRQPMHAMSLTTAAFRLQDKGRDLDPLFDRLDRSIHTMEGLVTSLLDISKLDAGTVQVTKEPTRISDVFSSVLSEAALMADAVESKLECEPTSLVLMTDRTLLESIVRNLVGNAIRHAPGSTVKLSARKSGEAVVVLSVCDDGPGIPEALHEQVFEEFFQVDDETSGGGGLGLGLAIVNRLTQLLGGSVNLVPDQSKGARFDVTLPYEAAQLDKSQTDVDDADYLDDLDGLRVVVLEDDVEGQAAVLDLMASWGCEAIAGQNANDIVTSAPVTQGGFVPQVVISDFQLSGRQDGPSEIRALRDHFANQQLPAALLTGETGSERLRELEALGLEVLHKPVRAGDLARLLARISA
ncbi:MAG: hybrid sensor histidine kinase/response regulator [Pseudomonadota bacterium]